MILDNSGRPVRRPPGLGRREYQPVEVPKADIGTYACGYVMEVNSQESEADAMACKGKSGKGGGGRRKGGR